LVLLRELQKWKVSIRIYGKSSISGTGNWRQQVENSSAWSSRTTRYFGVDGGRKNTEFCSKNRKTWH
jgi:hypothetical protein